LFYTLFCTVREADQGDTDLNGDGDVEDDVVACMDLASGETVRLPLATIRALVPFGEHLAVLVRERDQGGTSLNGDADAADDVLHVVELATGAVTNLGQASLSPVDAGEGLLAYVASELGDGVDYDGDGDADDAALHLATLDFPTPSERRYGSGVPGWREREPVVEVLGVAAPPRALVLQVRDARPGAPGCLLVGLAPSSVPAFAGELLVAPPFCATADFRAAAIGRTGLARVALDVLPPELAGVADFLQAGVVDPAAQGGSR